MTPDDLGQHVAHQVGRPAFPMTNAQIRAWATRVEVLRREHPYRTPLSICLDLGLRPDQASPMVAEIERDEAC